MAIKYHLAQDALQKIGLNKAIKRSILSYLGDQAVDAEEIKPTPVSDEDNKPSENAQ